jgi:hypothetical protein
VEGEKCFCPGRQNPKGGKIGWEKSIFCVKSTFSALNDFLKLLSQMKEKDILEFVTSVGEGYN